MEMAPIKVLQGHKVAPLLLLHSDWRNITLCPFLADENSLLAKARSGRLRALASIEARPKAAATTRLLLWSNSSN